MRVQLGGNYKYWGWGDISWSDTEVRSEGFNWGVTINTGGQIQWGGGGWG